MNIRALSVAGAVLLAAVGLTAPAQAKPHDLKIIDGSVAAITDAPWQVALLSTGTPDDFSAQFCGGSILASQWVVTAAHCLVQGGSQLASSEVSILAGKAFLSSDPASSGPRTPVSQVLVHPGYNPATEENDVAMLRLGVPLNLDGTTRTAIALPLSQNPSTWPSTADTALITGWGKTDPDTESYQQQLRKATIGILASPTDALCGSYGATYNKDDMLCAGGTGTDPVKDTCTGDSGGPLVVFTAAGPTLAGITSFGNSCGLSDFPGIYTRVTTYENWILDHIPGFAISTGSLDLGTVRVGDSSTATLTISNPAVVPLHIQRAEISGPYSVNLNSCGVAVGPGSSCQVTVTFTPSASGPQPGQLRFLDDALDSPQSVAVNGTGLSAPAKPGAPKGKVTTKKAKVSWKASTGATRYKVKVTGRNSKNKKKSATKTASSTSATVKIKLKKKSKARVCVQAANSAGTSRWTCSYITVK